MINTILTKIFGSQHERDVKKMLPLVAAINEMEPQIKALSDEELRAKTAEFRAQIAARARRSTTSWCPAFAVAREAAWRTVKMRPFDVQLMGGLVLHRGKHRRDEDRRGQDAGGDPARLPERARGQGRPRRHRQRLPGAPRLRVDGAASTASWVSRWASSSTTCSDAERKRAYAADITYGTNNEFGFDYLRDNMKFDLDSMVQRRHHYAIVDEVDSILIDEARTPLIISGPSEESTTSTTPSTASSPASLKGEEITDDEGRKKHHRRLHGRREGPLGGAHRRGRREGRAAARRAQPVRPREHGDPPRRQPGPARPRTSTSATSTTWSRTARSSSSTSSPAA